MRANFVRLIFVAAIEYKNIFTTKISRFTIYCILCVGEEVESGSEGSDPGEGGEVSGGGDELSELKQEVADLEESGEGPADASEVTVGGVNLGEEEEEGSEDEVEDRK